MNSNLQSILEPQEKIIWQGNVSRKVLSFNLALWLVIIIAFSIFLFSSSESSNFISYLLFFVLLIAAVTKFLMDYVKVFTITDKRIIVRFGLIGTDYNSIFFTEIKTASVQVDLIDKIFGVGSINIDTGKIETVTDGKNSTTKTAYDKLAYINKPYEVYKTLQSTLSNRQESLYSGWIDKNNFMSFELSSNFEQISSRREKIEQEINDFKNHVKENFSENDQAKIFEALEFMLKIHLPQQDRVDGKPFASHPLAVAEKVMELDDNPELVIAALIHDSVEDQSDRIFVERINRKYPEYDSLNLEIDSEIKEKHQVIFKDWSFKEIKDLFGENIRYYIENMTNHDFSSLAENLSLQGDEKQEFLNKLYAEHVENIINDPNLFTLKLADLSTNIDIHSLDPESVKYKKLKRKYKAVIESILQKIETVPINHPLYDNKENVITDLNKIYKEQYCN